MLQSLCNHGVLVRLHFASSSAHFHEIASAHTDPLNHHATSPHLLSNRVTQRRTGLTRRHESVKYVEQRKVTANAVTVRGCGVSESGSCRTTPYLESGSSPGTRAGAWPLLRCSGAQLARL